MSLWPVDDLTGCLIMHDFYRQLRPLGIADALGAANNEIRQLDRGQRWERYRKVQEEVAGPDARKGARDLLGRLEDEQAQADAPYYWAPFIHVGK